MVKFVFTKQEDLNLVKEVSKFTVLWDFQNNDYKNHKMKRKIWCHISNLVNRKPEDCKKRWRNIRDTYLKRRRILNRKSGSCQYTEDSKWWLSQHLHFLNVLLEYDSTASDVYSDEHFVEITEFEKPKIEEEENCSQDEEHEETIFLETSNFDVNDIDHSMDTFESGSCKNISTEAVSEDLADEQTNSMIHDPHNELNDRTSSDCHKLLNDIKKTLEDDAVDLFFKSIASTVKKFPLQLQTEAKLRTLSLISEFELGMNSISLESLSESFVQPQEDASVDN